MATPKYIEAIRLLVETSGDEELKALMASFQQIGDIADAEGAAATSALQGIADAAAKLQKIDAFAQMKRDLVEAEAKLKTAQGGVQALFAEFKAGDTSNAGIVKLQKEAVAAAAKLREEAERQRNAVHFAREELRGMGVDSRELASVQASLRGRVAGARTEIAGLLDTMAKTRAETAALVARRADFTRFMGDGADASEEAARALAQYQQRVRAAAEENGRLKNSTGGLRSAFGGLRSAVAGVGAYLGLREAAGGVLNLLRVAAAAEDTRRALQNLYGGQEAGNRAFDALKQLATDSGLSFQTVADQAKKLKSFGLDPLNGSLQSLVNQNAAVGGSQEELEGKVLALGQAWAKQKLQGEEILQLVERGVPVWALLEKVTGKNVTELQKLSEQGKLGRDTIKALYEEIGRANTGAAQSGLSSLSGLVSQASARWTEFLNKVADAGVTDYFKRQIQSLLGSTQNLDALAKRVADGIVGTLEALRRFGAQLLPVATAVSNFTLGLFKHAEAILFVGKVYAGLKIAQIARQFSSAAVATQAATTAVTALGSASAGIATNLGTAAAATQTATVAASELGKASTATVQKVSLLTRALALLPTVLRISLYTVGIEASISLLTSLNGLMEERQKQLLSEERAGIIQRQIQQELIASGQELSRVYSQYAEVAVQSGDQISRMTKAQAQDYAFALSQAQNYYRGLALEAKAAGDAQAQAAAVQQFEALGASIDRAKQRLTELATEAAKQQALNGFVNAAVANFDKLASKGESVRKVVSGIFDGLNLASPRGVEQAIAIFDQVSARGTVAAEAVRTELSAAIAQVADADLPRLQEAANKAMGAGTEGARAFAAELNTINLTRLNVDVEAVRTGFTRSGRVIVGQFDGAVKEVNRLGLTAAQRSQAIVTAFESALAKVSTSNELQALKRSLQDALSGGSVGAGEFAQQVARIDEKLAALAGKGQSASKVISTGMAEAAESVRTVQAAAEDAGASMETMGQSGANAGAAAASGADQAADSARSLTSSIWGASQEFARLLRTQNNWYLGQTLRKQQADLREQIENLKTLNDGFDELTKRRGELQKKFNLVDPALVEELVQAEKQLEDNRTRRAEAERKTAEDSRRQAAESLAAARELEAARASEGLQTVQVIRLEVVAAQGVQQVLGPGGKVSPAVAQQLAQALASPILDQIARARAGSNRRKPRR